jgi:hypothetical protein
MALIKDHSLGHRLADEACFLQNGSLAGVPVEALAFSISRWVSQYIKKRSRSSTGSSI